jgi:hypothetical protein
MITELIVLFSKIFNYIIDSLVNLNKWKLFIFVKRVVTTNSKCFEYKSFHVSGNSLRISSILIGILYVIETLHINWFLKHVLNSAINIFLLMNQQAIHLKITKQEWSKQEVAAFKVL